MKPKTAPLLALALYLCAALGALAQQPFWPSSPTTGDIQRFPGRVLIGAATVNDGVQYLNGGQGVSQSGFTDLDWLGQLSRISINGGNGIGLGNDINYSVVSILANSDAPPGTLAAPLIALTTAVQSKNSLSGASPRALNPISVRNNDASQYVSVWTAYFENHNLVAGSGNSYGMEMESRNSAGLVVWNPYSTLGSGTVTIALGAGAGLSPLGQYPATAAMYLTANPMPFASGFIFLEGSIGPHGPGGSYPAIQLPHPYEVQWFANANTVAASIKADPWGNLYTTALGDVVARNSFASGDGAGLRFGQNGTTHITGSSTARIIVFSIDGVEAARIKAGRAMRFVPLSGPPANPDEGETYYDGTSKRMRTWDGAAWRDHW